jgi:hypothetical protein
MNPHQRIVPLRVEPAGNIDVAPSGSESHDYLIDVSSPAGERQFTGSRGMVSTLAIVLGATWLAAGCAPEPDWAGTIAERDGVTYVSNAAEPLWGSADVPGADEETPPLRFELEQIYGVESDPVEAILGSVRMWTVDDDQNVYVLDPSVHRIIAFAADGSVRWTAGREGEGPGDLGGYLGIATDGRSTLFVLNQAGTSSALPSICSASSTHLCHCPAATGSPTSGGSPASTIRKRRPSVGRSPMSASTTPGSVMRSTCSTPRGGSCTRGPAAPAASPRSATPSASAPPAASTPPSTTPTPRFAATECRSTSADEQALPVVSGQSSTQPNP